MTKQNTTSLQDELNKLLAGDHTVLLNQEISQALPGTLIRLIALNKQVAVDRLLDRLISGIGHKDTDLRKTCATCLIRTAEKLTKAKYWKRLNRLLPALTTIHKGRTGDGMNDQHRLEAGKAISLAKSKGETQQKKTEKLPLDAGKKDMVEIREKQIFLLAESGNKDEAKKQLFDLMVSCARRKDFSNAERLRERIYEIDPMALMEIIQSGDIIEEEKSGAIDQDHLKIWANLLKDLTSDEFNTLYYKLEKKNYDAEETIVSQGMKNDELFFINQGSVRASYMGGEKKLFLKNLSSGEVAGENFFNSSVWTVSLTAIKPTQILALKRQKLENLEDRAPGIESKLRDFYRRSSDMSSLMKKKGMDRRVHERYRIERKIQLQVTGDKGKILSSFKGEMTDISQGGLSFILRISKKENSRLLLGRNVKSIIPVSGAREMNLPGQVISVQSYDLIHSEYTVHVKFNEELVRHHLQNILE